MKKYEEVLGKLTIDEKVALTHGTSNWTFFGIERLGYRSLMCADGPHGLRAYKSEPGRAIFDRDSLHKTTLFPVAAAMASTFQPHLIYQVGQAIGEECNMHNVDLLLAPGVNMKRSPLGGRNFEYYSEDPYLSGVCATAFINGVQDTGVGACIKHYALNEQENQRRFIDTDIDDYTLHEHYLRPFHYAIKHANPLAIMSSYNRVHGDYASESTFLLKDILRDQWEYEGLVVSDWGAVQNKVKSIKNGMNIEMPGPSEFHDVLKTAMDQGDVTEQELDDSLRPLFHFYDNVKDNPNQGKDCSLDAHHQVASSVAKEAIVLLENDGILPLEKGVKVAVIGDFAETPRINGGGSASLSPHTLENPLVVLRDTYDVEYAKGYEEEHTNDALLKGVEKACDNQDIILFFTGTTTALETEGKDREHMDIPEGHLQVFDVIKDSGKPVIVILNNGSAVNVSPFVLHANALVEAWLLGGANAQPLIDILTGKDAPSGRLAETFPIQIEHTPHYGEFPCKQDVVSYHGDTIRNGYRYYDTHQVDVRYPFGYGLTYTTFRYEEMTIDKKEMTDQNKLTVSVTLTNTGHREGKEVVQLYVRDVESYYPRPDKELKAFEKVSLDAGETKTITFTLDESAFAVYAPDFKEYRVEAGEFDIMVGTNVLETPLVETIVYNTSKMLRKNLTLDHPLKNFREYKPNAFKQLEDAVGSIPWYNVEEPLSRVLRRFKRRNKWDETTYKKWQKIMLGDNE